MYKRISCDGNIDKSVQYLVRTPEVLAMSICGFSEGHYQ